MSLFVSIIAAHKVAALACTTDADCVHFEPCEVGVEVCELAFCNFDGTCHAPTCRPLKFGCGCVICKV
ncbi:hypothetical protein GALMADRAFT_936682 [Galerina marginata CBS 339.88]|uniref:Uncharacterized protein n=1 Tax=Galerina marginata (strain CBS 339.88) TaxID=685588 RepID=A0A067SD98_GALM3|nr:hypothetical protein GALMADRAFT_936682 [Galerina marginata CBS 339.88]